MKETQPVGFGLKITLVNYPSRSFTQQELQDLQTKGVTFEANSALRSTRFYPGKCKFDSFGEIDYRVVPSEFNIALFEKLAGIPPKKTPRKHHELIKAWAEDENLVIEVWDDGLTKRWYEVNPSWHEDKIYRIKPSISEQTLKDIQQGLTTGIATCLGMLLLKEEV